jgi:ABC-2 type transport system ATP-binding protein
MVMDSGRMIADDTAPALKARLAGDVLSIGFGTDSDANRAASVVGAVVPTARIDRATHETGMLEVTLERGDRVLPLLLRELDNAGISARTAALRQPTLDDVFLALTGRSLRDDSAPDPSTAADEFENTEAQS